MSSGKLEDEDDPDIIDASIMLMGRYKINVAKEYENNKQNE